MYSLCTIEVPRPGLPKKAGPQTRPYARTRGSKHAVVHTPQNHQLTILQAHPVRNLYIHLKRSVHRVNARAATECGQGMNSPLLFTRVDDVHGLAHALYWVNLEQRVSVLANPNACCEQVYF